MDATAFDNANVAAVSIIVHDRGGAMAATLL